MPKRKRDSTGKPLAPDPLKQVPKRFLAAVQESDFNVCDFVVVLSEMMRLFDLDIHLTGPAEGSIQFLYCPTSLWISNSTKAKTQYAGLATELRFSLSNMGNTDDRLQFASDVLFHRRVAVQCTDSEEAASDAIVKHIVGKHGRKGGRPYTIDEARQLLKQPMPLSLRENYPHYTWPRWMFGAFEGFVMRRIAMKNEPEV